MINRIREQGFLFIREIKFLYILFKIWNGLDFQFGIKLTYQMNGFKERR